MLIPRALLSQGRYWQVAGCRGCRAAQGQSDPVEWQWETASFSFILLMALETETSLTYVCDVSALRRLEI